MQEYSYEFFEKAMALDIAALKPIFAPRPPGSIINTAARSFLPLLRSERLVQGRLLGLRLLIDDGEALRPKQQAYLNTLARAARDPVSWTVSVG